MVKTGPPSSGPFQFHLLLTTNSILTNVSDVGPYAPFDLGRLFNGNYVMLPEEIRQCAFGTVLFFHDKIFNGLKIIGSIFGGQTYYLE